MIYIYDILLNYIDGKRVYEFFEWDSSDCIEHIKRIPLFFVDEKTFKDLVNNEVIVSKIFLDSICNKTLLYGDGVDKTIKYSTLFTNGERCYGFEFNDKGEVICKSSLLLDEEDEIIENSINMNLYKLEYIVKNKNTGYDMFTRKEEKKINFVEKDLIYTYKNKNYNKINYLYSECFTDSKSSVKDKYERLIKVIKSGDIFYINKINYILNLSYKNTCKENG